MCVLFIIIFFYPRYLCSISILLLLELVKAVASLCVSMCMIDFVLQADILDVNQIFRDLGMLVHEQGEVVGNDFFL